MYDVIVVGGGAGGFFSAIQCAERNPELNMLILEKSAKVLSKVKISGGGRCNVTHACFDPTEMTGYYPRGNKELRGPFHRFLSGDMIGWLADRGVETHIEEDGRIFPNSNDSQTIIDCFLAQCKRYNIAVQTKQEVTQLAQKKGSWQIQTKNKSYQARSVIWATGSSPKAWETIKNMGYAMVDPVPSLFTFNIQHTVLQNLAGISVPNAQVSISDTSFVGHGPLLVTHWGLSGPAVLKLSAWAARELHARAYRFQIEINWVDKTKEEIFTEIQQARKTFSKKLVVNVPLGGLPKRLWQSLVHWLGLKAKNYASLTTQEMEKLAKTLTQMTLKVNGKSTFKEEFVTCGGVDTKEIHFKTMESKRHTKLYFVGEVNNIDAVTGGFNFQAAWTSAFVAAEAIAG